MKRLAFACLLLLTACQKKDQTVTVTEGESVAKSLYAKDYADAWPLTTEYVNLICTPRSDQTKAITATFDGSFYRLSDVPAKDSRPSEDIAPFVKEGQDTTGTADWLAKEAWKLC